MTGHSETQPALRWHQMATSVLSGHSLKREEAREVLNSSDEEIQFKLKRIYRRYVKIKLL